MIGVEGAAADVEVIVLGERYLRERGSAPARPAPELDRRRELPARLSGATRRRTSSRTATGSTRTAGTVCRRTRCACSTARWTAARTSCWRRRRSPITCASRVPRTSPPCAAGWTRPASPYLLDPRLVRGLDYYTRTAFEWVSSALASDQASTINAGGRYDGLAEALGGPPTPGVGFAMGLDRVLLAIEAEGAPLPPRAGAAMLRRRDRARRRGGGPAPGRGPSGRGHLRGRTATRSGR